MGNMRTPSLVWGFILAFALAAGPAASPQPKAKKVPLGPQVNSPVREILPVVSADGKTLFFTRENYVDDDVRKAFFDQATRGQDEKARALTIQMLTPMMTDDTLRLFAQKQSVWFSPRLADGSWGPAVKLPAPLNNQRSSWICSALPDGNTLLLGGTFDPADLDPMAAFKKIAEAAEKPGRAAESSFPEAGNKLIAVTVRTGAGWSTPEYLRIAGFRTTSNRNDFFLAPGNRVLLLSLINEDSVGGRDLYVSRLLPDGSWSKPQALGPEVNSPEEDISPFVAPDGVSLYFSSTRPGGEGGHDIYLAKRLDESWLRWSKPVNLGPEINTPQSEMNLTVDAEGRYAFLAQGEIMKEDIYVFDLPEAMRPVPTAFVKGRAHDPAGRPVAARITYERLRDGVGAGEANADRERGSYRVALRIGEEYGFRAEAAGYIAVSEKIDLTKAARGEEFVRDLLLVPIKPGAVIRLNNVFFKFAEATLLEESEVELERVVAILGQYPGMEVEIAGHTDSVGDERSNLSLSEARAAAVLRYLVDHGVAAGRLSSKGYGKSRPVATNDTDEGRQLNRRVEFVILKTGEKE